MSGQPTARAKHIDPEDLFRSLKIRPASSIKELWAPQADALRQWHQARANDDVLFRLNTGAGKTLIGLVAAQSLVNESKGKVVYCCATNQLVDQTKEKADALGIETATYYGGTWNDQDVFVKSLGPVLTNYAALFNGKSIFAKEPLTGIVFDDAHTAHDSIRSAFTLKIERAEFTSFYDAFVASLASYFDSVRRGYEFTAVVESRDKATVLMVPMFEVARHWKQWQDLLIQNDVEERTTMFAWAHVGSRLDRLAVMFDANRIEFTPLLPPVHTLRAFRKGVRRLYLSATLRVNDEFIRTFGKSPSPVVTPGGRAGDTERLFLIAPAEMTDDAARGWADDATDGLKAVIMVPSGHTAEHWQSSAEVFDSGDGHERIRAFAASHDQRLVFVARYDGIDLPGDDCRVMIVDGLPSGMAHLDRFFEVHLEREGISDLKIASRFVQLLGRTSRGMTDYGAVVLIGRRLREWVLPPVRRALLPEHLQKQLAVGEQLSGVRDFTPRELVQECLDQTAGWAAVYESAMATSAVEPAVSLADVAKSERVAWAERKAAEAIWDDKIDAAVRALVETQTDAYELERPLGAWWEHWLGFAMQQAGDPAEAEKKYRQAARVKSELGALPNGARSAAAADDKASSPQAVRMAEVLSERGVDRLARELADGARVLRDSEASAGQHEAAICTIGEYLGYKSWRGDKVTSGKGQDCVWEESGTQRVLLFDAKTRKSVSRYTKDYIGESAQHALWAERKYPDAQRLLYIVGPRVPATPQSTPPAGLRIVAPEELARIAEAVSAAYRRASERNLPLFFAAEIEAGLQESGLTWDILPMSLDTIRLDTLTS
jgi:hypothetical protein